MASSSLTTPSSIISSSSPSAVVPPSLPSFPSANLTLTIKLNHSNYLLWKAQLLQLVTANSIKNILDGSFLKPPQFLDSNSLEVNPDFSNWERYNALVLSWIFSSISEDLLPQIISFSTASEAWSALELTFASSSRARISELRGQLHSVSKEGFSATAYIQKVTHLCNTLAAIGEPVSYTDRLLYFLGGLGSEYDAFVVSITNRPDKPPLEEIHSLLQAFDFRLEKRRSDTTLRNALPQIKTYGDRSWVDEERE